MTTKAKQYTFSVDGRPRSLPRPRAFVRNGRIAFYLDKKVKVEQQRIVRACEKQTDGSLRRRMSTEALALRCVFTFVPPKSWKSARRGAALAGGLHTQKPDLDNLIKMVKDALQGTCWVDDCQVTTIRAVKMWGTAPRSIITVMMLDQ